MGLIGRALALVIMETGGTGGSPGSTRRSARDKMRIVGSCIFFAFAFATPANADWQYTKWGMTPQEVTAASGRNIQCFSDLAEDCSGTYKAGRFVFLVTFYFDRQNHKLNEVMLLLSSGGTEQDLSQAMQEKYGMWSNGLIWIDKAAGYSVEYDPTSGVGFVTYRPLHDAEKGGL